jgi:gluconate 5-dehydrogenase
MTLSMFDLSGRTAFISGSSRGIGFTVAEALAGAGARVILNSRSAEAVSKACDDLAAKGFDVHGMPFDVTNLDAVFFVGQAAARKMVPRGRGKIINICSLASEVGRATIGPYTTAKGAVKMLTKAMCIELAKDGIQVNGIGPGYFRTDLNTDLFNNQEFNAWVRGRTPAGRWGELQELKGAAIFLASEASSFVNGQVLYIDGGLLSRI